MLAYVSAERKSDRADRELARPCHPLPFLHRPVHSLYTAAAGEASAQLSLRPGLGSEVRLHGR